MYTERLQIQKVDGQNVGDVVKRISSKNRHLRSKLNMGAVLEWRWGRSLAYLPNTGQAPNL